ncbi:hypothetical protein L2E82_45383 [Cichorium intybus]|uniref:Uncharacterized protein n=1 Tax=Cichorium intybus TaxID=13427 RepID=A0ACB8ZSU9_CICIN|nr:hypothetical protein L2E82_45383 [Cichorium intybus]
MQSLRMRELNLQMIVLLEKNPKDWKDEKSKPTHEGDYYLMKFNTGHKSREEEEEDYEEIGAKKDSNPSSNTSKGSASQELFDLLKKVRSIGAYDLKSSGLLSEKMQSDDVSVRENDLANWSHHQRIYGDGKDTDLIEDDDDSFGQTLGDVAYWDQISFDEKMTAEGHSKGYGIVGLFEAAHDKQDFERSALFSRLELKLKQKHMDCWVSPTTDGSSDGLVPSTSPKQQPAQRPMHEITFSTDDKPKLLTQVIALNEKFPSPKLYVTTNYNVGVNVKKKLDESLLITWSGIEKRITSWQDGDLGTNCPIPAKWNWTYRLQLELLETQTNKRSQSITIKITADYD